MREALAAHGVAVEWNNHPHPFDAGCDRRHGYSTRCGRAAGHVHSPVGGQGMNTGLGDAVNLGWKLVAALRHLAPAALLDTCEAERWPFAQQRVATTDQAFRTATRASGWASFVRTRLVPLLLPMVLRLLWVRRRLFLALSQTGIAYPSSPLSQGSAAHVSGGMRLPWAPGRYQALRTPGWQVFCAGPGPEATAAWARAHGLPLTEIIPMAQETPGTLYLLRPDGYVGLVASSFDEKVFSAYLTQWVAAVILVAK